MPVGLEKEVYATLHNAGKCPAVAYVELPNENAGVRVEPSRCRIPVGGSQKLRITAQPAVPRQFDGLSLLANVRGAKTLRLPIAGVAVVPDVVLAMAAHFPDVPPPECDPDTGAPPPPAESFEFGEQRARLWTRALPNGWLPRDRRHHQPVGIHSKQRRVNRSERLPAVPWSQCTGLRVVCPVWDNSPVVDEAGS